MTSRGASRRAVESDSAPRNEIQHALPATEIATTPLKSGHYTERQKPLLIVARNLCGNLKQNACRPSSEGNAPKLPKHLSAYAIPNVRRALPSPP